MAAPTVTTSSAQEEESSAPVPAAVAPKQPDTESSIEPDSAAEPESSEAQPDRGQKEDEEDGQPRKEEKREQSLDPDWVEERFRIDRKKLENMLYGG